jgi:site-specific DNA-methyltransferase (adenine-specific)
MDIDRVYCGDCLDLMVGISDGSIDMVLCDLPYGTTACSWDTVIPFEPLWEQYRRIIKSNGAIVLTASQPFTSILVTSNLDWFRHEWIWIKNRGSNFANTVREPFKEHESVLVFSAGKWTYNKQMQARTGNGLARVQYAFNTVTKSANYREFEKPPPSQGALRVPSSWQKFNTEVGLHPTQKPVSLFEYLIRTYSNAGDLILDNCIGSGTTGVAAVRAKRHFIGIDISEEYCAIARERIYQERVQGTLF